MWQVNFVNTLQALEIYLFYRDFKRLILRILKIHNFYYKNFKHNTEDDTSKHTLSYWKALSSSQSWLTPSIIFCTSSTSEYPSLCLLEMS